MYGKNCLFWKGRIPKLNITYLFFVVVLAEGDPYFTGKLQDYTAVEKDEVILQCEISKADAPVKWMKDGKPITASKNVVIKADGKKRILILKKALKSDIGQYTCDCGTDQTSANLNIEGMAILLCWSVVGRFAGFCYRLGNQSLFLVLLFFQIGISRLYVHCTAWKWLRQRLPGLILKSLRKASMVTGS